MDAYYRWSQVPEHLKTKTQLGCKGLKPGGEPEGKITTGYGTWSLYDIGKAVPKRVMSEKQRAALEKARVEAEKRRCCDECGHQVLLPGEKRRSERLLCDWCEQRRWIDHARRDAARDAAAWLEGGCVILDTETTGLDEEAEIVEIAIVNQAGEVLLDRLVKPSKGIPAEVTGIHGIRDEDVAGAPGWGEVCSEVSRILEGATRVVIYNAAFDLRMMRQSCRLAGVDVPKIMQWRPPHDLPGLPDVECAMEGYARFVGEWSEYWGSFRWQRLPSGGHRALDDCLATLEVLREMRGFTAKDTKKSAKEGAEDTQGEAA